jgi:hypothetical protein
MGVHRRDKSERLTADGPPKIRVKRGEDGELDLSPDGKADGVHPETVAEERPAQADDPRTSFDRNVGGPYIGS